MIILDAFIRFTGIGLLMLLAVIALRDMRKWRSAPYLILTCISVSALFFGYAPLELRPTGGFYVIIRMLDIPHLVFIWLFALSLFEKNFCLRVSHIIIGIIYCAPILWIRLSGFGLISPLPEWVIFFGSLTSLALMGHLCIMTLRGRVDDLLEKRRASRVYFVAVIVFVTLVAAISEPLMQSTAFAKETFKIISIWPAIIWGVYWMVSFNQRAVTFAELRPNQVGISERDKRLKEKLEYEMIDRSAFKEPSLTIVTLAARLGVNQHRLRALINQILGYPNFSAFVNTYRIDAVKRIFSDSKNAHIPILTIAMDCGFKSLSPFNRTFKLYEGMTPTEYRHTLPS